MKSPPENLDYKARSKLPTLLRLPLQWWQRLQTLLQTWIRKGQAFFKRSSDPAPPVLTLPSFEPGDVPHPVNFVQGLEAVPGFMYWSSADLMNSIDWAAPPLMPRPLPNAQLSTPVESISPAPNSGFNLSLLELSQCFEEEEEETAQPPPPLQPSHSLPLWGGLENDFQWTELSAADLFQLVDWERSTQYADRPTAQVVSEDDLSLLDDLITRLPD